MTWRPELRVVMMIIYDDSNDVFNRFKYSHFTPHIKTWWQCRRVFKLDVYLVAPDCFKNIHAVENHPRILTCRSIPDFISLILLYLLGTPQKIFTWNLKITQLKRKNIFHPPPFLGSSIVSFGGCTYWVLQSIDYLSIRWWFDIFLSENPVILLVCWHPWTDLLNKSVEEDLMWDSGCEIHLAMIFGASQLEAKDLWMI